MINVSLDILSQNLLASTESWYISKCSIDFKIWT
jgi:hypothetical protein